MRSPHSFARIAVALTGYGLITDCACAEWEFATAMPTAKSETFAVVFNGDIYMIGGSPWVNGADQDGTVYVLRDGAWSSAAPLDGMGPVIGQGGGVDALGEIIIFGGMIYPEADLGESRKYDPVEGPFTIPAEATIYSPALNFGLATDDLGRIYKLGGGCDDCFLNYGYCCRYNGLTDSWEQIAYLPYARSSMAAAYDGNGHIWGFGGYTSFGLPRIYDTVRYTIATDTWATMGSHFLPVQTSDQRAVLGANNRMYVMGGRAGAAGLPTTATYVIDFDQVDSDLVPAEPLNIARYDFGAVLGQDDYIYVIGGITSAGPTSSVERLYTGRCPDITGHTAGSEAESGETVVLSATVTGGAGLQFAWSKDGVELVDGPTGHGSSISGANTTSLALTSFTLADAGSYSMAVSNPCGSDQTGAIIMSMATTPDLDGDGTVGFTDLLLLLGAWGPCTPPPGACAADLDADGSVGFTDLLDLLAAWIP